MHVPFEQLVAAVAAKIIEHAEELTALDSAIGDADHGLNMKRGFEAVLADKPKWQDKPLPEALKMIGMTLVMKVGGASGPLYGTLFMTLGKELPDNPSAADVARALAATIEAIKARGKADIGNKTMLDVLHPVLLHLESPGATFETVRKTAEDAAAATVPLKAIKGRASFLGDRSIGHMDPGARSAQLMISTICNVLEGKS